MNKIFKCFLVVLISLAFACLSVVAVLLALAIVVVLVSFIFGLFGFTDWSFLLNSFNLERTLVNIAELSFIIGFVICLIKGWDELF